MGLPKKSWLIFAVVCVAAGCGRGGIEVETPKFPELSAADNAAVAEIEKLGGAVVIADGQVVEIHLSPQRADQHVDDTALVHVAKLTSAQKLYLTNAEITDTGLEQLAGMKNLVALNLDGTGVTDAGLKHLEGLSKLYTLSCRNTSVTAAAVVKLKEAHGGNLLVTRDARD